MRDPASPQVIPFRSDSTLRWSFRAGEVVLWLRWESPFAARRDFNIIDLWEFRDGDSALLTNRAQDLPPWFELHPTEVVDANAVWMKKKLDAGYTPGEVMDGPGVWRVCTGDLLLWTGPARPDIASKSGILAILDCQECLLVLGEMMRAIEGLEDMFFGAPTSDGLSPEQQARGHAGLDAVRQLGGRRLYMEDTEDWRLG